MKLFAKAILLVEPLLLAIIVASFWFPEPYRVNVLIFAVPPMLARLILYRRLWVNTPLNIFLYLFLLLCAINTYIALSHPLQIPYSRGWYQIGWVVMGVVVALSMSSIAYERGSISGEVLVVLLVAVLVGVLGLGSAQYIDKSDQLQFLINRIPQIRGFPGAEGGFNVNEIGGAMTYFAPFAAGIALYDLRSRKAPLRLIIAAVAFLLLALALLLGQSRLAILGVVLGVGLVSLGVLPNGRWRYLALALLAAFTLFEVGLVTGVFERSSTGAVSTPALDNRDTSSLSQRPVIWGAALGIIRDYPLTGVGLNEFKSRQVRDKYPVPDFAMTIVPHAHNEFLQVGTDAGIPGMLLYLAWNITVAWMLWRAFRRGAPFDKAVAVSVAAGLLAHAVFGLADAITLFDRFAFAYWLFIGLAGGVYLHSRQPALTES